MTLKYFNVKNGLTTGNIILNAGNSNISASTFIGNINVTSSANLGAVGNIKITGGTANYVLSTDGAGNLSWIAQSGGGGGGSSISNGTSNVNIATANGNITLSVNGNTNIVTVTDTGINVAGTANLGNAGNVKITGGTSGYVLSTDGAGNLSWASIGSGVATVDSFTGNGVQTTFTLSITPSDINLTTVNYDGVILLKSDYTLSGSNVTLSNAPANGSKLEITTLTPSAGGGSTNAQDLLSPFLLMGA